MEVVRFLDDSDVVFDAQNPPEFGCEKCGGETYPENIAMLLDMNSA
ncbi:hypothetical protein [Enterococcus faecium]